MSEVINEKEGLNGLERYIIDAIKHIKYGAVEILIHDSRVVQIEKSEKVRFDTNNQLARN